ncbi:MAG: PqqD family protein [Candidatus Onthomonas sp.]
MKLNPDYILRSIAGENIVVPTGSASQEFNGMLNLNDTAAFIWMNAEKAASREELVQMMLAEFEVDEETARRDVNGFLNMLLQKGLATEENS